MASRWLHSWTIWRSPLRLSFAQPMMSMPWQALQHQAVAYLLKPVREAELARALVSAGRVNRVQLASLREGAA